MKIPASLRPHWRDLPGMAAATINAYLCYASPRVRRLLRLPGYAFGALVVAPWLIAAHCMAVLAAIGNGRSGALVITDTRSLRAKGAWVGCLVGAALTVLVAYLAALTALRLDAPAIVVFGVLLAVIIFTSAPLMILVNPGRSSSNPTPAAATDPILRMPPPADRVIVTPTLLAAWPRSTGNGSRLIDRLTTLADQDGAAILMHARTEEVAEYYEQFGFVRTGGRRREMLRLPGPPPGVASNYKSIR